MNQDKSSVFLERRAYRQRRLADAARVLPLFGAVLIGLPLLWDLPDGDGASTSYVMTYLFLVWLGLIVTAGLISVRLPDGSADAPSARDE